MTDRELMQKNGTSTHVVPLNDLREHTEKAEWEKAVTTYRCTDEQMARVHAQAEWCDKNTTYYSTYCYGTALIRNCTKAEGQV